MAAKESFCGGERGGVCGFEEQVFFWGNECRLALRIRPPEHEDDMFPLLGKGFDGGIGELFPSFVLVTTRQVRLDGERRIEQEYALFRPMLQVAGDRYGLS